jgi:hypothetical protein
MLKYGEVVKSNTIIDFSKALLERSKKEQLKNQTIDEIKDSGDCGDNVTVEINPEK